MGVPNKGSKGFVFFLVISHSLLSKFSNRTPTKMGVVLGSLLKSCLSFLLEGVELCRLKAMVAMAWPGLLDQEVYPDFCDTSEVGGVVFGSPPVVPLYRSFLGGGFPY